ncbi:MAG: hypothetical protein KTR32_04865 [Granulosicoccus sp.]|nr:hypothetical protein [Granulosicoccus sp.]
MPIDSIILILLIGLVFGGISAVVLRSKKSGFFVNVLLGVLGAALGAYLPIIIGASQRINVANHDYLLRALLGSFLLVVAASLFRSARTHH